MKTEIIVRKMHSMHISKTEMAKRLGISRRSLYNKLEGETQFTIEEIAELARMLHFTNLELMDTVLK